MNKIITVLTIIIALLSLAAGAAKVMQAPQEVEFLTSQGLSLNLIIVFGIIQILGGVLLLIANTRLIGAVTCLVAFVASAIFVFKSGSLAFALISMIPVATLVFIAYKTLNTNSNS